jgi:hypothetical protein
MARTPTSRPPRFCRELARIGREDCVNLVLLWNYIDTRSRAAHNGHVRSRLDELLPLAEQNDGLVTASQARVIGILDSVLARLTQRGELERVARGVYRIPYYPADRLSQYREAILWVRRVMDPKILSSLTKPHWTCMGSPT